MKKLLFALLLLTGSAVAQLAGVNGDCTIGGQQALTQNLPSTATQQIGTTNVNQGAGLQASFPNCIVLVYLTGTTTKPTIYSNNLPTPTILSNPLTANGDGSFTFFIASGCYDITISSGSVAMPYSRTYSDVCLATATTTTGLTGITPNQFLAVTGTTVGLQPCAFTGQIPVYNLGSSSWNCGVSIGSYGVDANTFPGVDPCVQIQNAIYSTAAAGGGIINATNIPVVSGTSWPCSVNPFSTPAQTSPVNFTGLPTAGLLLLPDVAIAGDYPFYAPNKWGITGVGGYGPAPSRTTLQPSANFLANRTQLSAAGGGTGCSSSGGQTVTITGTTLPAAQNLIGMWILCSSNAGASSIPTPQTAQMGGIITAVSSGVITLSGAGAAGTVSNTGWVITPVVAGWGPTQTFGSALNELVTTCQTPSGTYVTGCIGFVDVSGNESAILSNFTILGADYFGLGLFSAQSQNGGQFSNVTVNWSANGNNNTIGIELGGSGWNAGGGGGSGLCSTGNPCNGIPNRGFFGFTVIGSGNGTGNGGTGFDVNSQNITITQSHCESLVTCALIGSAAVARNVRIDNLTGCTASPCAITSVVDISATYQTGSVPAPTQAIQLTNILPGFASTWAVRDFINLVGSSDPVMNHYEIGDAGNGSVPPMVFTSATLLSCITTGGVLSNVGSSCAAGTQIPIISQVGGTYYAHGFNNNGVTDLCAQMNNAMKWAYAVRGITSSVIIDATGFNRPSPYACATNPFAGAGSSIPASGVLRLGLSALSFSVQWVIPAGWIVQGLGGAGLGAGGATGSLLLPNVNGNTVNANFANDTIAGTVSTTQGSVTVTGASSNFTSANVGHYLLACATLPCTTQSTMAGGIITAVSSTTSATLDVPAQATLSGAHYTITPPLIVNSGIIRDVGIDGFSFGTGSTNGNGGLVGVYQQAVSNSYLDNVSFAHINSLPIDVAGANVGELSRINITSSGTATSVFTCVVAPSGMNIRNLNCATGTTAPTLSYGVYASGQSFTITNALFQDVNIGVELAVSNTVPTNAVTLTNIASGGGATAATTLVDLAGVNLGTNTLRFAVNMQGLACGGCTTTVNDNIQTYTATDATLESYVLGQSASSCRNFFTDSQTTPVSQNTCLPTVGGKTLVGSLPAAASNPYTQIWVTDSTAISAEGQTCVGGSSNKALAISNGVTWRCF